MSAYRVLITRRAERDVASLMPPALGRIRKALLELADDPMRRARRLTNTDLGQFRLRVGDWRIVFDIDGSTVIVLRIGHRREIYRGR